MGLQKEIRQYSYLMNSFAWGMTDKVNFENDLMVSRGTGPSDKVL